MIPPDVIERVRQASDVARIIGEYVRLKKRGKNFIGLCPFHVEKTPSFTVTPDKGIYHCFGCSKGGNVITFLMEHERMSFVDAVRLLAQKSGIVIREERGTSARREHLERLLFAQQIAADFFHAQLGSSKYSHIKEQYLEGKRGIEPATTETFQIGLAGEAWDGLIAHAAKRDLSPEDLVQAGLAIKSENGKIFDRFRQRLMFPIANLSGKTIGFGGRTLTKGDPVKYMNSPETPLYHKGEVLYGLNHARDHIRSSNMVVVVEGYFDLISLWQIGVRNVVASSGTAFTAQQARLLARFGEKVVLFFDADSAGRQAALRSVDVLFDAALDVVIVAPPKGEDPDSLARAYGIDKIEELIHEAVRYIPFRLQEHSAAKSGFIEKEKLVKEFGQLGGRIADPTRRALFLSEAANLLDVDQQLFSMTGPSASAQPLKAATAPRLSNRETEFLSLLLQVPGNVDTIFRTIAPSDFASPELGRLYAAMIAQYEREGTLSASRLIESFTEERMVSLISSLAVIEWQANDIDEESHRYLGLMNDERKRRVRALLQSELKEAEARGDHARATELLEELARGLSAS